MMVLAKVIALVAFTGGLSLQIEHHLFPRCPIDKLPGLSLIVEEACTKRGLPYHKASLASTVSEIWTRLRRMEQVSIERLNQGDWKKNI